MTISHQSERRLILIAVICTLLSAIGWMLYSVLLRQAPLQDFMVFYTAGQAWRDGDRSLLYDGVAFTAHLNQHFAGWLAKPISLHPWVYPPVFLFVVVPLAMLPFPVSCGVFLIGTFAALNLALRGVVRQSSRRWLMFCSLLLSPATAFTLVVGQNAFLATALMVGGFGLLGRAPVLAGAMLGLLSFKPQLWLLVPVALVAARQWRALASAVTAAGLLALASAAVFGLQPWLHWLALMRGSDPQFQDWLVAGRLYGQSIFTVATLLGAPARLANAAQALAVVVSAAIVWRVWRAPHGPPAMRLAVLLAATVLAAPHVSNYDAEMLVVAVSLLLCRALDTGLRAGEGALIVVAWGIELLNPPKAIPVGLITPLVVVGLIAVLVAKCRPPAGDAPSPRPQGRHAPPPQQHAVPLR